MCGGVVCERQAIVSKCDEVEDTYETVWEAIS